MAEADSSRKARDVYVVRNPEQAQLLTETKTKLYFAPFVAQERTVSQAAREAGCSLGTMFYRVGTFLEAGLLRVAREEQRAGRAIKYYRAIQDAFFIPFELTPYAGLEERLIAQLEPLWHRIVREYARLLRESNQAGQYLYRDEAGVVWTNPATDGSRGEGLNHSNALLHDVSLTLTEAQARELQNQLWALSRAYQQLSREGTGKQYLLQIALVPRSPFT